MERLVFNTPSRFGEGNGPSGPFVMFTLFFLGFLAIFSLGFVVWYLIAPQSGERLARNLQHAVSGSQDLVEQREREFLFRDDDSTPLEHSSENLAEAPLAPSAN